MRPWRLSEKRGQHIFIEPLECIALESWFAQSPAPPEISAKVKTPAPGIPDVNENISFSQLFHHLSWIPFFGSAELRNDRYGVLVDYTISSWIDLHAGYRSLNVNYSTKNDVGFNVNMDGPIIAGTFHF